MDHEQNDQLISAYLDGELSADERARVEQLLATSAEARQLVEELKAIRAGLQSLPQHRLEPDFAQQVLRRAEQERQSSAPASEKIDLSKTDPWQPSVFRSKRGIAWSAIAIAAAVIIMVATRNDEQHDRQIARQAANAPVPQGQASPVESAKQAVRGQPADEVVRQKLAAERGERQLQPSAAPAAGLEKKEGFAETKTNTPSFYSQAAPQESESSGNVVPQMRSAVKAARSSGDRGSFGGTLQSRTGGIESNGQAAAPPSSSAANSVLIVQVGLKQNAAASNEFAQVLANNRITLELDRDKTRDEADRKQDQLARRSAPSDKLDVVYVETSPEQLTAVLKDLTKSKSLLSMGSSASAPLPDADKDAAQSSRARRIDALHDWVAQNLDNLPQTIALSEKSSTDGVQSSSIDEIQIKAQGGNGGAAAASSPSPSTENLAPPGTAQLYPKNALSDESLAADKANPRPLVRAVFILRNIDSAAPTSPAAKVVPAEQSGPSAETQ